MFFLSLSFSVKCQEKKSIEGGSGYVTITYSEKTGNGFKVYVNNYSSECSLIQLHYMDYVETTIQVDAWCGRVVYINNSNQFPDKIFKNLKIYKAQKKVISENDCRCSKYDKQLK